MGEEVNLGDIQALHKETKPKEWFSIKNALSYNLMTIMVLSERSIGKTYSCSSELAKICVKDLLELGKSKSIKNTTEHDYDEENYDELTDEEKVDVDEDFEYADTRVMIWIRRNVNELDDLKDFMSDIKHMFPDFEFSQKGTRVFYSYKGGPKTLLIKLYSIKWAARAKGNKISKFVKYIVFDEFLPEDGKYYTGWQEPTQLMLIAHSFIRDKDDCNIILLANALQFNNPYFKYFNCTPSYDSRREFNKFRSKDILIQMCPVGKYRKVAKGEGESRFDKFVKGTAYEQRAATTDFLDMNEDLIERRSSNAVAIGTLQMDGYLVGVWYDHQLGKLWYSSKTIGYVNTKISFDETSDSFESQYNIQQTQLFDYMMLARSKNAYRFDSQETREIVRYKLKGSRFL